MAAGRRATHAISKSSFSARAALWALNENCVRCYHDSMREVLTELTRALDAGTPCVYCSVVETRGSTPQKAGAAMLVFPDGRQVGTLGGGCVEAEVKRKALGTLAGDGDAKAEVLTFNLDDNYGWD